MYKPVIEVVTETVKNEQDNGILRVVHNLGINVDKAELLRALQYDRNQYEIGYEDGKRDSVIRSHWIMDEKGYCTCANCHEENDWDTDYCPNCGAKMNEEHEVKL